MQLPIRTALVVFAVCVAALPTAAQSRTSEGPDTLVMNDGRRIHGMLVHETRDAVTLQTSHGESTYPRTDITRILDEANEGYYFVDAHRRGTLPPWDVLVNDLRHNDQVRSLEQIPATVIEDGVFRRVPYLSFRINGDLELNIYGDPLDPAGIEIGIYGRRQNDRTLRRTCREFLAGYLTSGQEIQALYALSVKGEQSRKVGDMVIEVTPPDAPDAYGALWLSVFNPRRIEEKRLSEAEYRRLTLPVDEVLDARGMVLQKAWTPRQVNTARAAGRGSTAGERVFARGFYRDNAGVFRLVPGP
jgi:hypothetical protein